MKGSGFFPTGPAEQHVPPAHCHAVRSAARLTPSHYLIQVFLLPGGPVPDFAEAWDEASVLYAG